MTRNVVAKNLVELERLRNQLYGVVNGDQTILKSREACEVSHELDKLIVSHMYRARELKLRKTLKV